MINETVGENIRRIRNSLMMTIGDMAKISGVSKSMLGQIERGDANPTIATVWKIANGLKVPFSMIIELPEAETQVVDERSLTKIVSEDGLCDCVPFFPFDAKRNFEMYEMRLKPECNLKGEPHPKGTLEYMIVFDGEIKIEHGQKVDMVKKGQAFKFKADKLHCYYNTGTEDARFALVIQYDAEIL